MRVAPSVESKLVHEFLCLVYLRRFPSYVFVGVLKKEKVGGETNVCVSSLDKVVIVGGPLSGVFKLVSHHRSVDTF